MQNNISQAIQDEMMARRQELIGLQNRQGGCAAIDLKADKVQFCYNPARKVTRSNPRGDKFYLTGIMNGCPVMINEFDVYDV